MRRAILKIIFLFLSAFFICNNIDYTDSKIVNPDFLLPVVIDILGIALAITAIFFTVVDRYKEKNDQKSRIEKQCFPILNEMCENVFGILLVVIVMFITSIIEPLLVQIVLPTYCKNLKLVIYVYVVGFFVVLAILIDITQSILGLVKGLFISQENSNREDKYDKFLEECRQLDQKHFSELIEYTKTLILKQTIDNQKENMKK